MLTTGCASFCIVTSSNAEQVPLDTVHFTVAVVPAANPVTVVVGELGEEIVAVPLTNDHTPVPADGALCVIVKEEVLHKVWFG